MAKAHLQRSYKFISKLVALSLIGFLALVSVKNEYRLKLTTPVFELTMEPAGDVLLIPKLEFGNRKIPAI